MSSACPAVRVIADQADPPTDWDARAVEPPGGHVMQSAIWGTYRASQGWDPHFLTFDDERVALALLRSPAGLPGSEAVVRRGPAYAHESPAASGAKAAALARWAREAGARTLYLDPERPADPAYARAMDGAGFGITDDLGENILADPVSIPDFHATVHHALGIDPAETLYDGDRPVPITDGGRPIPDLFA